MKKINEILTKEDLEKKQFPTSKLIPPKAYFRARNIVLYSMNELAEARKIKVVLDDQMGRIVKDLIYYFFEIEGGIIPQRKGIYIWGDIGTGKSFLMRVFQRAMIYEKSENKRFKFHNVPEIYSNLLSGGIQNLNKFNNEMRCFDDLGTAKNMVKDYGNAVPFEEVIISNRYERFVNRNVITHGTGNLSLNDLAETYEERVGDRIREMFFAIRLTGENFRRQN